jgi:hypothetical protein
VGPRTGLDDVKKRSFLILSGLELRNLGRPTRSQSLCRLRYLGSLTFAPRLVILWVVILLMWKCVKTDFQPEI